MKFKLILLVIPISQIPPVISAVVTVNTVVELTKTLPPGGAAPTSDDQRSEITTATDTHPPIPPITSHGDVLTHETEAPVPTADIKIDSKSNTDVLTTSDTASAPSSLLSVATTAAVSSTTSSPESATSPSPSPSLSSVNGNTGATVNKSAIIGGVSAGGALLIAGVVYLWWRLQRRGKQFESSSTDFRSSDNNTSYPNPGTKTLGTKLGAFNIFKDSGDRDSSRTSFLTSFKDRESFNSFYNEARNSLTGAPSKPLQRSLSISHPMPIPNTTPHQGHDTITNISDGPYGKAFEQPRTPPPVPQARRSAAMSVIDEYSQNDHSDNGPDDGSRSNQGYPISRSPPPLNPRARGRTPNPNGRHDSHVTTFPGFADETGSVYGAMGSDKYIPPKRPNVRGNAAYTESVYSQYTDVRFDTNYGNPPPNYQ